MFSTQAPLVQSLLGNVGLFLHVLWTIVIAQTQQSQACHTRLLRLKSIYLSVYLSIDLSIYRSIDLSIYL